jgi:hypothetical protein
MFHLGQDRSTRVHLVAHITHELIERQQVGALIGARMPHSTYMLSFPDLAELKVKWAPYAR